MLTVLHKVGVPKSNIARIWTPIFEWYEVRCGSRNRHQKDMCSKEIRLRAQNCSLVSMPQSQTTYSSVCVCLTMAVCDLDCYSKSTRPTSYTHKECIKVHCFCPVLSSTITDFPFDFQDDKYNWGSHGNSMGWCSL